MNNRKAKHTHGNMASKIFHAVIMGAPGSGKGTISERIIKHFGIKYLACGDLLRQNIQQSTALGKEAQKFIADGQLVPDDLVIECILKQTKSMQHQSWLLDGFPRTKNQAQQLSTVEKLDVVLNLVVPHDVIIERIQGRWIHMTSGRVYNTAFNKPKIPFKDDVTGEPLEQREDDKPETVKKRLDVYERVTKPVIDYYKSKNLIVDFCGRTSDEIWPQVNEYLQKFK